MKLSTAIVTGLLTLNIIAVAFTASVKTYTASDSESFGWKEHASDADKRSMGCSKCGSTNNNAEVLTAEKTATECAGCSGMGNNPQVLTAKKRTMGCIGCPNTGKGAEETPNPMNPYLTLKPFLPIKPAFVPPFMDPNYFINKKADLLNNLFGASNVELSEPNPSSMETKRDSIDDESANSLQPRLAPFSPFLALTPKAKPTIVPPEYWMPMSGPGIVDPAAMIDKKTKFLNTLFSKIDATSPVAAQAIAPKDVTSDAKQSVLPTDFWLQFLPSPSTSEPPTVKPTIVPSGFWIPSSVSKSPAMPFGPKIPIVDPSELIEKKTAFLNALFKVLNTTTTTTPAPETSSEPAPDLLAAYKQKAASSTVNPTIAPPGYWKPMSGPGIVDPATMIDKKTKFLNTLFSKIAAPDSSAAARAITPEDVTSYTSTAKQFDPMAAYSQNIASPVTKPTIVPPGYWMPMSGPGIIDPATMIDKKTKFLNTLFSNIGTPDSSVAARAITPEDATSYTSTAKQFGPMAAYSQDIASPVMKPTIVPPGYWMPMGGPGIIDPAKMIDKKTKFLNTLFSKIGAPDSSVANRAIAPEDVASDASSTIQGTLPTNFWLQFLSSPAPPTVKPTIVPPGFWIPSSVSKSSAKPFGSKIPIVDPSEFIDKKTAFLNTLFKTLNISTTPTPSTSPEPTPDPATAYKQKLEDLLTQLISSATSNNTQLNTLKRSMAGKGENYKSDNENIPSEQLERINDASKVPGQPVTLLNKRSTTTEDISVQSSMSVEALLNAKDKLMNTIMDALAGIKNNILDTLTELLAQQKVAAESSASPASKKTPGLAFGPGGPFGPWGAALLKTMPKPTPNPTPFQNKVEFLSQMFDALTKVEKDISDALNEAINDSFIQPNVSPSTSPTSVPQITNATALLQLIKSKISELANDDSDLQAPKFSRAIFPKTFSAGLPTPKPTIVEPSFWIPKVTPGAAVDPTFYLSKAQDFLSKLFASKTAGTSGDNSETTSFDKVRSIKMAVHQGYQSLPPGTEELLQAGGGSNPEDHEGGGLKLQIKVPA